jgi:hypothetical protein
MNALVPQGFHAPSSRVAGLKVDDDLQAGLAGGFGIVGIKGKAWHIRHRSQSITLMREDGDGPRNSIEVVVVKAATPLQKTFYANGYEQGSDAAPDCFSMNGVTPDVSVPVDKRVNPTCANCPKAAWGSKITDAGKKAKACTDSRRLAIVPDRDLKNEMFGGPMLLRVPAASLDGLAKMDEMMKKMGFPICTYVTKISFDPQAEFPKLVFTPARPLSDDEVDTIMGMRETAQVGHIIGSEGGAPASAEQPALPAAFANAKPPAAAVTTKVTEPEGPAATAGGFGVAKPAAPPAAAAPAVAAPKPAPIAGGFGVAAPANDAAPTGAADFDKALDEQLAAILPPAA